MAVFTTLGLQLTGVPDDRQSDARGPTFLQRKHAWPFGTGGVLGFEAASFLSSSLPLPKLVIDCVSKKWSHVSTISLEFSQFLSFMKVTSLE